MDDTFGGKVQNPELTALTLLYVHGDMELRKLVKLAGLPNITGLWARHAIEMYWINPWRAARDKKRRLMVRLPLAGDKQPYALPMMRERSDRDCRLGTGYLGRRW